MSTVFNTIHLAAQPSPLDELFTDIREAIQARYEAGYQRGRYLHTPAPVAKDATAMLDAVAKADERVAQLWHQLYDLAPAFADALQVLEVVRGLEVQA